ncbi:MAG: hypothetical protein U0871_07885 [Gemmataceae bacterium]
MTTRFRPLCLDPFEDRAVPSRGHFALVPPESSFVAAHRADLPAPADDRYEPGEDGPGRGRGRGSDERGPQLTAPGRSEFAASRFLVAVVVPPRADGPAPAARPASVTPAPPPVADRAAGAIPDRPAARAYETEAVAASPAPRAEPPAVGQTAGAVARPVGQPLTAAVHEAVRAAVLGAAWPHASTTASVVATPGSTGPAPAAVPVVAADSPGPDATQGQPVPSGVTAAPVAADPAAGVPEAVVSAPSAAAPAPAAETAPAPSLVGRVIEAVFPAGGPLGGVLPVDLIAVEADAAGLLAGLADLGDAVADGWAGPERWAWLTAAALTAGGVGYVAVGDARGRRRAGPAAVATDSALARWEERNGDRTG